MKNKKLIKAAEEARKDGYEYMHSLIIIEKGKPLYHVVNIDLLIRFGRWLPASIKIMEDGNPGVRVTDKLPEKSISRANALSKYK